MLHNFLMQTYLWLPKCTLSGILNSKKLGHFFNSLVLANFDVIKSIVKKITFSVSKTALASTMTHFRAIISLYFETHTKTILKKMSKTKFLPVAAPGAACYKHTCLSLCSLAALIFLLAHKALGFKNSLVLWSREDDIIKLRPGLIQSETLRKWSQEGHLETLRNPGKQSV